MVAASINTRKARCGESLLGGIPQAGMSFRLLINAPLHIYPVLRCRKGERLISISRHGTLMARLIAGICPSAIIHVIKLHTVHWIHPPSSTAMGTDKGLNLLHSLRHVAPQSSRLTRTAP